MLFKLKFADGSDEFAVDDEVLRAHPDTMLSTLCKPLWAASAPPDSRDIQAVESAEASWCDGMADQVVAWYAGSSGTLLAGVELADWVAVADWLMLPLGDLDALEYEEDDEGDFAREVRAKIYLKGRKNVVKAAEHMKTIIKAQAASKVKFGFLLNNDNLSYINGCLSEPLLAVGNASNYGTAMSVGVRTNHYQWAEEETLRNECVRILEASGLKCTWSSAFVELSGARGMEYPPMGLEPVHGSRRTLAVTVPPAEPASKRRRTA